MTDTPPFIPPKIPLYLVRLAPYIAALDELRSVARAEAVVGDQLSGEKPDA